jgi:hypothetical protein
MGYEVYARRRCDPQEKVRLSEKGLRSFPAIAARGGTGLLVGYTRLGAWRVLIDGNKHPSAWSAEYWELAAAPVPPDVRARVLFALRQCGPMTHAELYAKLNVATLRTHLPRMVADGLLRVERVPTSPSSRHDRFVYHLATDALV